MTQEIINKVCKTKKVNKEWFDHVFAYINDNYTKVFITFANLEVVGGGRMFYNKKTITLSVAAIQRERSLSGNTPRRDGKGLRTSDRFTGGGSPSPSKRRTDHDNQEETHL